MASLAGVETGAMARWALESLACPCCGGELSEDLACRRCGERFSMRGGIPDLVAPARQASTEEFLAEYRAIRQREGWVPVDPRLAPYADGGAYWRLRRRSFEVIQRRSGIPRGLAIDLGAGTCWLSARLATRGWRCIACDLNEDARIGLRAADELAAENPHTLLRVRGSLDEIPFRPGCASLVVLNAALTYAADPRATLLAAATLLGEGGRLILADTPIYRSRRGGESMRERIERRHARILGRPLRHTERFGYVLSEKLFHWLREAGLGVEVHTPRADWWWFLYGLKCRVLGREPVSMPVIIATRRSTPGGLSTSPDNGSKRGQ